MNIILIIVVLFLFLFLFLFIGNNNELDVFGHANPVLYNPPSNSIFQVDTLLPNNITILYSERPEQKVSYIHVINPNNERIDNNDLKIIGQDERGASVTLDPTKLFSGTYTISWLVLSKDDGHITKGSYVFTISDPLSTTNTTKEMKKFSDKAIIDNINLEYEITPFVAGMNTFTIKLIDEKMDRPIENIKNVIMQFNNQDQNIGPIIANLKSTQSPGVFTTSGAYLSQEGQWNIKITVQRSGEYDLNHRFDVVVPS